MMNETIRTLMSRRSIRHFTDQRVPDNVVNQILEAGLYAPSGVGSQNVVVVAITRPETLAELRALNCKVAGWGDGADHDPFYGAKTILLVMSKKGKLGLEPYDGALVMGNLMNTAWSLGVGSCWVHRAKEEIASDWGKAFLARLGLEGEYEGIAHCCIGYFEGDNPKPAPRKADRVIWDR